MADEAYDYDDTHTHPPVVNELSHELEHGRGARRVVVPQLDGPLQDGHVGRIPGHAGQGPIKCYLSKNTHTPAKRSLTKLSSEDRAKDTSSRRAS